MCIRDSYSGGKYQSFGGWSNDESGELVAKFRLAVPIFSRDPNGNPISIKFDFFNKAHLDQTLKDLNSQTTDPENTGLLEDISLLQRAQRRHYYEVNPIMV